MGKIITQNLPMDLPENWTDAQYVSPGGVEVGLSEQHGYNYLMRQVNNTQKATKELDDGVSQLVGVNLLDNAYFVDPIDRKRGYIVPPGTLYYSDKTLSTQAGAVSSYTATSKVNDTYGTITINSVVYYVSWTSAVRGYTSPGFTLDRWQKSIQSGAVTVGDDCITLLAGAADMSITQFLPFKPSIIQGQRVTLSILLKSGSLHTRTAVITASTNSQVHFNIYEASDPTTPIGAVYYNLTGTGTGHWIVITALAGKSVSVKAIKLEIGARQTLAQKDTSGSWIVQEIPNKGVEMAKCVQYDTRTGAHLGAVPSGYIEEMITVASAEELDARLDSVLAEMIVTKVKFISVDFSVQHPALGGGTKVFRIDKIWDEYAVVQVLGYRDPSQGSVAEFLRSKFNGVWTAWARSYNTLYKPTPPDIGAAAAGFGLGETAVNTANVDANKLTRTGFYGCEVNTPDGSWWYGLHIQYTANYAYQKFARTNDQITAERWCFNGAWSDWKIRPVGTNVIPATVE